jgi:hypothetical protein
MRPLRPIGETAFAPASRRSTIAGMSEPKKKPGVAFWASVGLVA